MTFMVSTKNFSDFSKLSFMTSANTDGHFSHLSYLTSANTVIEFSIISANTPAEVKNVSGVAVSPTVIQLRWDPVLNQSQPLWYGIDYHRVSGT